MKSLDTEDRLWLPGIDEMPARELAARPRGVLLDAESRLLETIGANQKRLERIQEALRQGGAPRQQGGEHHAQ